MLSNSQTAVLEKNTVLSGEFATDPFEVAWAKEARWFFQVIERSPGASAAFTTQISPDGLHWVDLDGVGLTADDALVSWSNEHFGHWLRIRGAVTGGEIKVRVYLALKG